MRLLNNFKSNGFSKISGVFSRDEISKLRHECLEILDCPKNVCYPELPERSLPNSFVELYQNDISRTNWINQKFRNCIGVSKEIDDLLVKFFHNSEVNEILSHFFVRPKLQFCTIRYADDQSNWLGIHSDSGSTISMSILLNDTYDTDTTTVFIKGSHLYNKPVKNKIERLNPRFFSNIVEYSTGTAGDVNIFFNRTAHGVVKQKRNNKNQFNAVILLCFHCDQNLVYRTLKLPTHTLYGKNINLLDGETLKFFETDDNEREVRNRNIKKESKMDENVKNYRKLRLKEFITYFYLKLFEYFIKTVRVFK
jgi:putative 2OG-Fe(II) oxygenase